MEKTSKNGVAAADQHSSYPDQLVRHFTDAAEADAQAVGKYLIEKLGSPSTGSKPLQMPAILLMGLAAALRLKRWEADGYCSHEKAVGRTLLAQLENDGMRAGDIASLVLAVYDIRLRFMAWPGSRSFGGDILLADIPDEDMFIDALAQYLWATRHEGEKNEQTQEN